MRIVNLLHKQWRLSPTEWMGVLFAMMFAAGNLVMAAIFWWLPR
jgi:hypothetical protein